MAESFVKTMKRELRPVDAQAGRENGVAEPGHRVRPFEFRCGDGSPLRVVFALDCCDREAMSWVLKYCSPREFRQRANSPT